MRDSFDFSEIFSLFSHGKKAHLLHGLRKQEVQEENAPKKLLTLCIIHVFYTMTFHKYKKRQKNSRRNQCGSETEKTALP